MASLTLSLFLYQKLDPNDENYYSLENWEVIPFPTAQAHTCVVKTSSTESVETLSRKYSIPDPRYMNRVEKEKSDSERHKAGTSKSAEKSCENEDPKNGNPSKSENSNSIVHPLRSPSSQLYEQLYYPVAYPSNFKSRYPYYM